MLSHDRQHSYPDICLVNVKPTAGCAIGTPSLASKRHLWIRTIKLKYGPDPEIHGRARHTQWHNMLHGTMLCWMLAGLRPPSSYYHRQCRSMTAETVESLRVLGINPASSLKLAKRLAVANRKRTAETKRARLCNAAGLPSVRMESIRPATDLAVKWALSRRTLLSRQWPALLAAHSQMRRRQPASR